jgi:hypothetical protein
MKLLPSIQGFPSSAARTRSLLAMSTKLGLLEGFLSMHFFSKSMYRSIVVPEVALGPGSAFEKLGGPSPASK